MKLIAVINGWTVAPECWRHFFIPPLRIQRERALLVQDDGEYAFFESPAVYSIQVLGVVLFLEINRGMRA